MNDFSIGFIQEPSYSRKKRAVTGFDRNFQQFHADNPRAALIIGKNLNAWEEPSLTSRDLAVAVVKRSDDSDLYLASLYLDILATGDSLLPPKLTELLNIATAKGCPLIIAADSNAHSYLWSDETNQRGEAIEDFMALHSLNLANIGTSPTFVARGTATAIDITLLKGIDVETGKLAQDRVYRTTVQSDLTW